MASTDKTSLRKHLRVCHYRRQRLIPHSRAANFRGCRKNTRLLTSPDPFTNARFDSLCLVEGIVGEKLIKGRKFYKVRWQGFPPEADSWEPESNLSNVLDSSASSHQKRSVDLCVDLPDALRSVVTNSPVSSPNLPSDSQGFTFDIEVPVRSESHDHRTNQKLHKRKNVRKSRIAGRYEYVPKHQLVASKTKYFDDIRDGKIDLSSNDLYSRVKTRRRANEIFISRNKIYPPHSLNSSTQGDCSHDTDSRTSESSVVRSVNRGSCFSMAEGSPRSAEFDHLNSSLNERTDFPVESKTVYSITPCTVIVSKPISVTLPSSFTVDQWTSCASELRSTASGFTQFRSSYVQAVASTTDVSLSPARPLCDSPVLTDNEDSAMGASCANSDQSLCDAPVQLAVADLNHVDEVPESTVSSLPQLISKYFSLVARVQAQTGQESRKPSSSVGENKAHVCVVPDLSELPKLQPYHRGICVLTEAELVDAVNYQHWTLLATVPSHDKLLGKRESLSHFRGETFGCSRNIEYHACNSSVFAKCSPEVLLPLLTDGPERPTLVDSILSCGFDPNTTLCFEKSNEPLLIRAVCHRRVHVVQALLDAGAKPDQIQPGSRNRTALGVALAAGDLDMVTLLMLAGSNFYQVETQTTALSFVLNLLKQHSVQPDTSGEPSSQNGELDSKLRASIFMPPVPSPLPPSGISTPILSDHVLTNSPINTAQVNNGLPRYRDFSHLHPSSSPCPGMEPPPAETLKRMYDLIAVHHARLSVSITELVHGWLFKSGLTKVALLTPCQWVNVRMGSFSVSFTWPMSTFCVRTDSPLLCSRSVAPILLLVHGRITPPACYDTWMDDDGPCLIKQVCLDGSTIQKPLGRAPFVTTLFPLDFCEIDVGREHHVRVDFRVPSTTCSLRPTCIAIMIIAVTPAINRPVIASSGTHLPHTVSFSAHTCRSPCSQRVSLTSACVTPRRTFS